MKKFSAMKEVELSEEEIGFIKDNTDEFLIEPALLNKRELIFNITHFISHI